MGQLISKLFEKGTEGFPGNPLTKGDVLDAAITEPAPAGLLLAKGEDEMDDKDQEGSGNSGGEGADEGRD